MLQSTFELPVAAAPEKIWNYYEHFSLRKTWEHGLESYELHGPFAAGTKGSMQMSGMPPIHFTLTVVETNKEFWDSVSLPGLGTVLFGHELFVRDKERYIRHTICFSPAGTALTEKHFGFFKLVTKDLAEMVWSLKTQAEGA